MEKKTYNGWTNYETWLANLWYDDAFTEQAQECYDDAESDDTFTREENAAFALADVIESYIDECESENIPQSGFAADMINAAMKEINYHEIARHYIDDVDKEEESEEEEA